MDKQEAGEPAEAHSQSWGKKTADFLYLIAATQTGSVDLESVKTRISCFFVFPLFFKWPP